MSKKKYSVLYNSSDAMFFAAFFVNGVVYNLLLDEISTIFYFDLSSFRRQLKRIT